MVQVLVPLYAISLGFSVSQIGVLIGLPFLVTLFIRFVGGVLADRFGEDRVLQGCFLLMTLCGLLLILAETFLALLGILSLVNISRGMFWTPAQALVTQIPGVATSKILGYLLAANYTGLLLGLAIAGVLARVIGYDLSFAVMAAISFVGTILGLLLPRVATKPIRRSVWQITGAMLRLLSIRQTWLFISVSTAAGLPFSLAHSIYPVYMAELGYSEQSIGFIIAVRSMGSVFTGLALGSIIIPARERLMYALGMFGLAISFGFSNSMDHFFLALFLMFFLGVAGSIMDLLYQVQTAHASAVSDRSTSLASSGLGWTISATGAPPLVGWTAEMLGFAPAFLLTGIVCFLTAAGTNLWFRLLRAKETPVER